ncbi:MAG TPA: endolytic transglycosylase MltG [Acidimicrobiales bacterium]|nr:endolytic transglycosylase MltG [Acidimicrobiales bacterium]
MAEHSRRKHARRPAAGGLLPAGYGDPTPEAPTRPPEDRPPRPRGRLPAEPSLAPAEPSLASADPGGGQAEPSPLQAEPSRVPAEPGPVQTEPSFAPAEPVGARHSVGGVRVAGGGDPHADERPPVPGGALAGPVAAPDQPAPPPGQTPDDLHPAALGHYISYVDAGLRDADGVAIASAVYVDQHGYAEDGSYVGPPLYVDEHGYVEDGTYIAGEADLSQVVDVRSAGDELAAGGYGGDGYGGGDDGYGAHGYGAHGYGSAGSRRRHRRRHPLLGAFLALVVFLFLVVGGGVLWASHEANPGGKPGAVVTVKIKPGESTAAIGKALTKAGVIHGGGTLFHYYVRFEGGGPLQIGTYRLAKDESYDKVITQLQAGPVQFVDTLVIPEGFTLNDIAARVASLPKMHYSAKAFLALSRQGSVTSPFEPKGVHNLEGLLYPATYKVPEGMSEASLLSMMEGDFVNEANQLGLRRAAAKLHMTPYQVITVASIIQGEAKFAADGPKVASVIYNRLKAGMTLGDDSTLVYALRRNDPNININKINYEQPNPYNTRLNKGLPPTPIDNPSETFLQAAMHPAKTKLLYFVEVNPDGALAFSSSYSGFLREEHRCAAQHLC